jgi:hypothetical protein
VSGDKTDSIAMRLLCQTEYKRGTEVHLRNKCCHRKVIVTYSECVFVALVIRHAKRMPRIILTSL